MAGQVWQTSALGGYMFSVNLSRKLRTALQPMIRFRQFCDAREAFGLGKGDTFNWNIYSDVATQGAALDETLTMPESNFTITQGSLTITEYGNSVPFTKKLDDLSEHPVTEVIHKVLKNDARKALDAAAQAQFIASKLTAVGDTASTIDTSLDGTPDANNASAMLREHIRLISDFMVERDIPSFDGTNYFCIGRPTTFRALKTELEAVHQYVSEGWHVIMNGEKGRYEGVRFVEQTNVANTTAFDTNSASGEAYFFGADTVVEAFAIPEEIRGKIPTDFGRSRGIAWYAELGYSIVHNAADGVAAENRIVRWASLA